MVALHISTLFFIKYFLAGVSLAQPARNTESRLLQHILKDYDPSTRPVANISKIVNVRVGVNLQQIIEVDFVHEMLTVLVWIRMYWKDEFLTWKTEDFGGLKSVVINRQKIWVPDITLYNSILHEPGVIKLTMMDDLTVSHNGDVYWSSPIIISSTCKMDVHKFPYDKQRCHLEFGSWVYDKEKLDWTLHLPHVDNENYVQNEEWAFYDSKAERLLKKYNCCPEPWPTLLFTIFLERSPIFFIFNLLLPCAIITVLSIFSFILPPSSGERVSFIMTVLVAYSVYMMIVGEKIPHSSEVPLASKFFVVMMSQQALSLVATCLIIRFHNNDTPVPKFIAVLVNKWLARLLWMRSEEKTDAKSVDPTSYYLNTDFRNENGDLANKIGSDDSTLKTERSQSPMCQMDMRKTGDEDAGPLQKELQKLNKEVKVVGDHFRDHRENQVFQADWSFATQVLDRFFVILFAVSFSISVLIIMLEKST